jgi:hypothetical protein
MQATVYRVGIESVHIVNLAVNHPHGLLGVCDVVMENALLMPPLCLLVFC